MIKNDASMNVDAFGGVRNGDRIRARVLYLFFYVVQCILSVLDNDVHVFIFDKICTAPPGSPRPPLSDKIAKTFLGKLQKIVPKM